MDRRVKLENPYLVCIDTNYEKPTEGYNKDFLKQLGLEAIERVERTKDL